MSAGFETFERLVRSRRTSLRMDLGRPVERAVVERLIGLVVWAPNHMLTMPWRFAVFTGDGRARLGEAAAIGAPEAAAAKARTKYLRAPVMVVAGAVAHDDPVLHGENRDAVAAGVENMLLGATALGLASYWSTGATAGSAAVRELCGFGPADQIVAVVYLGWPEGNPPNPTDRPRPEVRWIA